jgi:hypothetical protein
LKGEPLKIFHSVNFPDTSLSSIQTYLWPVHLSAKTCLRGKTPPRLGHLAPASVVAGGLTSSFILELADHALFKMVIYVLLRALRQELDGQDVPWRRLPSKTRLRPVDEQAIRGEH